MGSRELFVLFAILAFIVNVTQADDDDEFATGGCMSLDCDAKTYKPVCGGLDAESSTGFVNECALQIYNCQHDTEWVVQTEVECEVAFSESSGK